MPPEEAACNKNFELSMDDVLFISYPTADFEVNKYKTIQRIKVRIKL